ncbi:hypothetical protein [Halostagnicola kamekurae]|uniref:Putative rep protein n=1 Tax=Halostagnicola kamekurae TaxID=619731 RepID=A0A1I6QUQ4_9EURY|nr:Putative rep protein [Halostagnicola kamekurae]
MDHEVTTSGEYEGGVCLPSPDSDGHTCPSAKIGTPRSETQLLAEDSPVDLTVKELAGLTLAEATDVYKAHRAGEAANERYTSGTLLGRARRRYGALLSTDRQLRQEYDNPTVAMLTLTANPVFGGEWITPLEHTEALTEPLSNVFATLRYHLREYKFEYAAVRGATDQGVSHWHIVMWIDGNPSPDTFAPAVESFINNCDIASQEQHPLEDAVKVNTIPSQDLKPIGKTDRERGTVSKLSRYVATQIPHVSGVDDMSEAEAMQGAIEWAASSRGFRTSSGIQLTNVEDRNTCRSTKKSKRTIVEKPSEEPHNEKSKSNPCHEVFEIGSQVQESPRQLPRVEHRIHNLTPLPTCSWPKCHKSYRHYLFQSPEKNCYKWGGKNSHQSFPPPHVQLRRGKVSMPSSLERSHPRFDFGRTGEDFSVSSSSVPR